MTDAISSDYGSMSMLELFLVEVENHCNTLADNLLKLEKNPEDPKVLETLMRAAHSTKGAARIIKIDPVVQLTHAMEDVFVACQEDKLKLDQHETDILLQGVDLLAEMIRNEEGDLSNWIGTNTDRLFTATNCIAALTQKTIGHPSGPSSLSHERCDGIPAVFQTLATDGDMHPLSILDLFRIEVETNGEILAKQLLQLEENPFSSSSDLLESLMRASHSIKGAARIVKLDEVIRIAHAMEDVFITGQTGEILFDHQRIDLLLQSVDLINAIAAVGEDEIEAFLNSHSNEIETIVQYLQMIVSPKHDTSSASATRSTRASADNALGNGDISWAESSAKKETFCPADGREGTRSIRISAENMSRLMGLAGEMLIESRWLPTFSNRLQRLKSRLDELLHIYDSLTDDLVHMPSTANGKDRIVEFRKKIETCKKLTVKNNSILEAHARHATEISHCLYHEAIATRMLPFADGIKAFPRVVRDLSRELGKNVKLEIIGASTPVDRDILEKIEAPLNHIIRNAIDHGIEPRDVREKSGKPPESTLRIEAFHRAGMLNIVITDDGQGIDLERIRRMIMEKKLVDQDLAQSLSSGELIEFLFLPNFTTRKTVSKISGRGVGLDVVRSVMHEVGGVIYTSTQPHRGTRFELQLPQTLSVIRALIFEVDREPYALPLVTIDHIVRIPSHELQKVRDQQYILYNDKRIGLVPAKQLFKLNGDYDEDENNVIIVGNRMNHYGILVNRMWGVRDLIIQPLNASLGKIKDVGSASILEDGTPVLILDIEDVLHSMEVLVGENKTGMLEKSGQGLKEKARKRVLVADDSITVREVERKILRAKGYQVDVAVDGMDAWNMLQEVTFDLIVADIDMPRMDGIELVNMVKSDAKYEWLPIIIVSYKDRKEDRHRGMEAGADYYLTKSSFQNESFVNAVRDLIGEAEK